MEISKKQKIINNLNMLLSKQQVDNKLITNLKTDLEAAKQHTRKYKFRQVMTTELVTGPRSTATTETQTDVNMDDLDADGVRLIKARYEVLRLGNDLVEKDNRIAEYERELHSQIERANRDMEAKDEIIQALESELEVQREELVERPRRIASTGTQMSVNMVDLDDIRLQLIKARNEVLRLGNELVEKDNRITEYESELHSQIERANRDMEAREEIIQALESELEVQREELVTRPRSTASTETQTCVNMADLDASGAQLMRARDEVQRLRNELVEKDEHITEYERELHSQREQAKTDTQRNDEIIKALDKELAVLRKKVLRYRPQTTLHDDQYETGLINTEINSLECQAKSDRLSSTVENLQRLHEEVAALSEQLYIVVMERDQLTQERDDLIFKSEHQVAVMEAMQKDNDALKHETEYLQGQCNNVAAIKEQLKTVTAEQQHIKEVRDALQLQLEHLQGQCNDIAEITKERDKLILQHKRQASGTEAVEKARDALELETNVLQGQCVIAQLP
jgi:chromosome segregation ATPase